ncbi:MAG: hypothetical protein HY764_00770 [Candidatus Portnoybacteria bacterium]|nr:hypothetical protein [Candidatus Portnoybacteria bacterium]
MRKPLIYSDLTHKIIGALFSVFNNIGSGHKESFYQKGVSRELE